jgi:uncharacterized protein (DUF302 family)
MHHRNRDLLLAQGTSKKTKGGKGKMNRILLLVVIGSLALFVAARQPAAETATGLAQRSEEGDRVDVVSAYPFTRTVDNLIKALKEQGMMIVATIDHQNMLRMVGASIKGSKTIEFGKPDMGKMLLPKHPEAGLEMPGKVYVWERSDGKTVVSYYKPSAGFSNYKSEEIRKVGEMMEMMVSQIVQKATH